MERTNDGTLRRAGPRDGADADWMRGSGYRIASAMSALARMVSVEGLEAGFGFMEARIMEHRGSPLPSRGGASPFLRRCQSGPPD